MPFLPSIEREDKVPHVLSKFNQKYRTRTERPLIEFHQALLRGDSPFTVQERLGLTPIPEQFDAEGKMITEGGYAAMLDAFGIK